MRSAKYWLKHVGLPDNRLPKAAYETVKCLADREAEAWASATTTSVAIRLWDRMVFTRRRRQKVVVVVVVVVFFTRATPYKL